MPAFRMRHGITSRPLNTANAVQGRSGCTNRVITGKGGPRPIEFRLRSGPARTAAGRKIDLHRMPPTAWHQSFAGSTDRGLQLKTREISASLTLIASDSRLVTKHVIDVS